MSEENSEQLFAEITDFLERQRDATKPAEKSPVRLNKAVANVQMAALGYGHIAHRFVDFMKGVGVESALSKFLKQEEAEKNMGAEESEKEASKTEESEVEKTIRILVAEMSNIPDKAEAAMLLATAWSGKPASEGASDETTITSFSIAVPSHEKAASSITRMFRKEKREEHWKTQARLTDAAVRKLLTGGDSYDWKTADDILIKAQVQRAKSEKSGGQISPVLRIESPSLKPIRMEITAPPTNYPRQSQSPTAYAYQIRTVYRPGK